MIEPGPSRTERSLRAVAAFAAALSLPLAVPEAARAADDEIQVYTDDIRAKGEHGLELHSNYVTQGRLAPDYPGEQPPGRVLRVTPEFSFGLGNNWDMGFYLPYSADKDTHTTFADGGKLRVKYLINNQRLGASEFYGLNLEVARASLRTSPAFWQTELRSIVGMRRGPWLFAMNPILSTPLSHNVAGGSTVDFTLDFKASREVGGGLALGVEHYAELGPVRHLTFGPGSGQSTFAALDYVGRNWDINFGVGHGWTDSVDKRVVKMIVGLPF